jgi:ribose 5-phosphate isomerase A
LRSGVQKLRLAWLVNLIGMDLKHQAAAKAIELIRDKSTLGLGGGATVAHVVRFLAQERGLSLRVATSSPETRMLLEANGFLPIHPSLLEKLDLYLDGCDQIDRDLNVLKSMGGIHTQEKLMAAMASEFVVLATADKWVPILGGKFPLTIEVIPEAMAFVPARIKKVFALSHTQLRIDELRGEATITTNGNLLFDLWFLSWPPLELIDPLLKNIPGIVETSLFFGMATKAIIADAPGVAVQEKPAYYDELTKR